MRTALEAATGLRFRAASAPASVGAGGGFAECQRWESDAGPVFVKLAPIARELALEAEADALRELATAQAVRVPRVLGFGTSGAQAFLALEWIEFGPVRPGTEAAFGEQLARLHRVTAARFGWHRDNTIGATPQPNAWDDDWVRFFRERRLGFQLDLAAANGLEPRVVERGRDLGERCGAFFSSHRPVPSLLHGDLWGGNWGVVSGVREPAIFDPAVYYGDRETDIAMTRLFGGFGPRFYAAYQAAWPLDQAAGTRRTLYNLYHVLNHFNLFGGGYGRQAAGMIDRLLAEFGA